MKKLIIPGIAFLTILIALAIIVPRLFDTGQEKQKQTTAKIESEKGNKNAEGLPDAARPIEAGRAAGIKNVEGQFCGGRAVSISGDDFGEYSRQNSKVIIDGREAAIITWEKTCVKIIVPQNITAGSKQIVLTNPPYFNSKSIVKEFTEHAKTQVAKEILSPSSEKVIETKGFTLYVPVGAVSEEQEITVYKYNKPAPDDSPYYSVAEEFEVVGKDGRHIVFKKPVAFGLNVSGEEEAMQSSIQIFDEYMGEWVDSEVIYNRAENKLYLVTGHFSGFRRFASEMYKGSKRLAGETKKDIEYIYNAGKKLTVKLVEEVYVLIKDAVEEKFIGASDANGNFIVYYRESDAAKDPSIPEQAKLMAAAFSTAYDEYKKLFGAENVPPTVKYVSTDKDKGFFKKYLDYRSEGSRPSSQLFTTGLTIVPDPIKVYIDPRYNGSGAKAGILTKNIIMPSEYSGDSLATTCAHELFHAVQYHQLGIKQIYMANGLKDFIDNSYTGGDSEVYRFFSDNKWFLEAAAEYAGRFVGTSLGVGSDLHKSIDASRAYYALNGFQEYGVSSFLDYIITARQKDEGSRSQGFKELWDNVVRNYGVASDVNTCLDKYVQEKLGKSTQNLYEEFWKDAFTRSFMPQADFISGGVVNINRMARGKITSTLQVGENGVAIFRYNFTPASMFKDDTAFTRSFWLEASPVTARGEVYRLPGIRMEDRLAGDPPLAGKVNISHGNVKDMLVPYTKGDTFGLVGVFKSNPAKKSDMQVTLSSTSVQWDNQEDIEKKVGNATITAADKLKFSMVLPGQKEGDAPFNAVVTLNNSEDYKTEIDKVENGKPIEVNPPMKELPPEKISANIKIFKGGNLVHEYQSGEVIADAKVYINGPSNIVVELTKEELPYKHNFTATAWPEGEYRFNWIFNNGIVQDVIGKGKSNVSESYYEFKQYKPSVTLYDLKDNRLASYEVILTLKEKVKPAEEKKPGAPAQDPGNKVELDPDSKVVPIASSGSFVCRTWINTSMDSFVVGGGTLTGANWSYSRGYRGYNLTGTAKAGETVSLNIAATMGEMGYSMKHNGNNLIMHLKVYDTSGKEIKEATKKIEVLKSGSKSLSDAVSIAIPAGASKVEMFGSFSCNWVTPNAAASETVSVKVNFKVIK